MKDLRTKLVRIFAAFALLFTCAAIGAASIVSRKAPRIQVNNWITPNPPTRANLQGKVYVIEFWATWCPACVRATPRMIELANKYTDKGVLFIGLSEDKTAGKVRNFIRQMGINYHIGMDNGISKKFLFRGIPTAFVISHTGKVVWQGHPMNQAFETAIISALKVAPPPFLAGLELGPFGTLRLQLSGGRGFAKAYRQLKTEAEKSNSQAGEIAGKTIKAIDSRIEKKIEEAAKLRESDPAAAFTLYQQILKNYRGIEVVKPAVAAYDELKNDEQVKNEVAAANAVRKAEKLLAKCSGCSTCGDFNPGCSKCAALNRTTLDIVKKLLTAICKNYKGTKPAETAQERLKELNSEVLQVK